MGDVIGGQQSPKRLLDAVLSAAAAGDLAVLKDSCAEFLAVPENIHKCIDSNGNTIAHLAVRKDPATLRYIVAEYGADVNATNNHGKTPLHIAVTHNYAACAEYLLKAGAKDGVSSATLSTPFHTAASCGSVECLELLLANAKDKKERLNEADRNKCTALHKCAHDGGLRVAKWLVEQGADVDAKDIHETTPLLVAAKMSRIDVCELLIKSGADVTHVDERGNSAAHYAASKCLPSIFHLLADKDATALTEPNIDGNTPLHLCFIHPRPDVAGWEGIAHRLIREHPRLLDRPNVASKKPAEYLGRSMQADFTVEAVAARDRERAEAEAAATEKQKSALDAKQRMLAERRAKLEEEERQRRDEQERLQREAEDAQRAEEEARVAADEEAEARRLEEEEAKRKKKEKAAGKGKKK
eukprot:CAMPEP_0174854922 /NCGR_PEP_ID=MMETSP1114-20130205/32018_1 /TAXON_ID=312471 /ORGANISM="Neobodo designis, Strain CCAP 1951/1" /LENGTH=412 /DNA_ID=CAMNT_0016089631 /DNA_START=44 /DNA_END=1282 /DNA_ORIENTATION=+